MNVSNGIFYILHFAYQKLQNKRNLAHRNERITPLRRRPGEVALTPQDFETFTVNR